MRDQQNEWISQVSILLGKLVGGASVVYYWLDTHSGFMVSVGTLIGIMSTFYDRYKKWK